MPKPHPMPPEMERKYYYEGIELFNHGEYFEAHEAWEEIWRMAMGPKCLFYQGLIQCAVALEHYRRSNPAGVISLYNTYRPKFRGLAKVFMGLNLGEFLPAMAKALEPVVGGTAPAGPLEFDASKAPKIALMYDPFETGEAARQGKGP